MTEKEMLEWCLKNKATVYFGSGKGVAIKVKGITGTITNTTLETAIASVEWVRQQHKEYEERHPE